MGGRCFPHKFFSFIILFVDRYPVIHYHSTYDSSPDRGIPVKINTIKTDVLCVGGGIAGLMAAIRAAELGAKVIIAEKANTLRSGAGAVGNDHFRAYIPEYHGPDIKVMFGGDSHGAQPPSPRNMNFNLTYLQKTFDIVKLWDSWGISMKHDGKWEFSGHGYPGAVLTRLKYSGANQ